MKLPLFMLLALLLEGAIGVSFDGASPNTKAVNSGVSRVYVFFTTSVALTTADEIWITSTFFTGVQATAWTSGTCTFTPTVPDADGKVVIPLSGTCTYPAGVHLISLSGTASGNLGTNPAVTGTAVAFTIVTTKESTAPDTGNGWFSASTQPNWGGATPSTFGGQQSLSWIKVVMTPNQALAGGVDDWIAITASPTSVISSTPSTIVSGACTFNPIFDTTASGTVFYYISQTNTGTACNLPASTAITLNITSASATTALGTNPASTTGSNTVTFAVTTSKELDLTGQTGWSTAANAPAWGAAIPSSLFASTGLAQVSVSFTPKTTLVSGDTFTVTANPSTVFTATAAAFSNVTTASGCTFTPNAAAGGAILTTLSNSGTSTCSMAGGALHLVTFKPASGNIGTNPASGAVTFSLVTSQDSTSISNQTGWTVQAIPSPLPSPSGAVKLTSSGMLYFCVGIIALLFTA